MLANLNRQGLPALRAETHDEEPRRVTIQPMNEARSVAETLRDPIGQRCAATPRRNRRKARRLHDNGHIAIKIVNVYREIVDALGAFLTRGRRFGRSSYLDERHDLLTRTQRPFPIATTFPIDPRGSHVNDRSNAGGGNPPTPREHVAERPPRLRAQDAEDTFPLQPIIYYGGHRSSQGLQASSRSPLEDVPRQVFAVDNLLETVADILLGDRNRLRSDVGRLERELFEDLLEHCMEPPRADVLH